jgi:hypothetical protein
MALRNDHIFRAASSSRRCELVVTAVFISGIRKHIYRLSPLRRPWPSFQGMTCHLNAMDFARTFRKPRDAFQKLLTILHGRDVTQATRASEGVIDQSLALTLRIVAGALYLDSVFLFAVHGSNAFLFFMRP